MLGDHDIRVAPEVWAKLDPPLRQALVSLNFDPGVALPVTVVLAGTADPAGPPCTRPAAEERAGVARQRQAAFATEVAGLVHELAAQGATEVQPAWLGRSVGARVALPGIEAAARRPETRQVVLAVRRRVTA